MPRCERCGLDHGAGNCPEAPVAGARVRQILGEGSTLYNYQLRRMVGEGATSRVFLAENVVRGDRVAVKVLRPELHNSDEYKRRFAGEARALTLARHENVVRVLELGVYDGWQSYMLMEFLEGTTLAVELEKGPMPLSKAAPLLLPLCDALENAHRRGVVHRDLKPENIYLVPRGEGVRPVLMDFGAARRTVLDVDERRTTLGTIVGTAPYMSPEQAIGRDADARSDVYSFGVILFEVATGRVPFDYRSVQAVLNAHRFDDPPSPKSVNPAVGSALEQVILRCLAKEPKDRFPTMADLGRAIFQAWYRPETPPPVRLASASAVDSPGDRATRRRHHRTQKPVDVAVEVPGSVFPEDAVAADMSESGAFIATMMRLPLLFSPVWITVNLEGHDVILTGEVVRVEAPVPGDRGRRGFAVRFDPPEPDVRRALLAFLDRADPLPSRLGGDPEISRLLQEVGSAPEGDHYAVLGVTPQADVWTIRTACERLIAEIDPSCFPQANEAQRRLISAIRERLSGAEEALVDPLRRAEYDASRGNFAGVAQCLSEGLTLQQVEDLRGAFLIKRPQTEEATRPHLDRATRCEQQGDRDGAMTFLAIALQADPLNAELQRRFWALRGKL
jgi:serine/threonine protein kinase